MIVALIGSLLENISKSFWKMFSELSGYLRFPLPLSNNWNLARKKGQVLEFDVELSVGSIKEVVVSCKPTTYIWSFHRICIDCLLGAEIHHAADIQAIITLTIVYRRM